jgi:NAD(P)-dependent dehydrogenase (short-subunit alcohol dehydrogenase family)
MARGPDIIDIITGAVAATLSAAAYATYKGSGVRAISTVTALFAAAYWMAPRRKFPTAETVCPDVSGKVAIVTGATSGIGIDTAAVLYRNGATVYIVARDPSKLETTKDFIVNKYTINTSPEKNQLHTLVCDLSDLNSVQQCAQEFLKLETNLDILINNAGIMALPQRMATHQGLESQVGVCHVGHFLLTQKLLPAIQKASGRVVCLSSTGHRGHNMKQLLQQSQSDDTSLLLETIPYDPWVAYGNAKCCNLLFATQLSRRGVTAFSVMPGGIHTGLQTHVDLWTMFKWMVVTPFFFKSTSQGAATSIVCATSPDVDDVLQHSGQYFDNCKVTDAVAKVESEVGHDAAEKLWDQTEQVLKKLGFFW